MRVLARPLLQPLCLLAWLAAASACSRPSPEVAGGPLTVALVEDAETRQTIVRVTGWSSAELRLLRSSQMVPAEWNRLLHVSVPGNAAFAVAGQHRVAGNAVEMVPQYTLDRGREYMVRVDPSVFPASSSGAANSRSGGIIESRVALPTEPSAPSTLVTAIYPSASVWPENILRFYLHFSAPMGGTSAVGHVRLVDERGEEVRDALLDIDVDLWNSGYTRRTVFFDPGRVKRQIKPNVELGRALVAGRDYAIVVATTWRDGKGQPLLREFRHTFKAGPPVERAVEPSTWTIAAPAPGTRAPLVVRFPWPLDEGLLHRVLGVTLANGQPVEGVTRVVDQERAWSFTPGSAWQDAPHGLVVLTLLEDPSGNKVGQAFEFEMFNQPRTTESERITIPFRPR